MCLPDEVLVYGDCAVNPNPDAEQLADIAIQSAASARRFGIEPRVAMISFSTGESGAAATWTRSSRRPGSCASAQPGLAVDGPLQYDAAAIARRSARASAPAARWRAARRCSSFPTSTRGNTTYKAVQRSADVISIGPMLQGLRQAGERPEPRRPGRATSSTRSR